MALPARLRRYQLLVATCFLVTGASSLVLETLWSRSFGLILGNALHGVSIVVGCFLGGLGLGAYTASRLADRMKRPIRAYSLLELGIASWAILGVLLLPTMPERLASLFQGGSLGPARLLAAGLFLVPPTFLMGMTLPVLVVGLSAHDRLLPDLSHLYGLNTFGGFLGTLLGGFVLLPRLGVCRSSLCAAAVDIGAGIVALAASRRLDMRTASPPAPRQPEPEARSALHPRLPSLAPVLLPLLFAFVGAAVLATEIAWTRALGLILGSSIYTFSLILATFLLGAAAGSLGWRWATPPANPVRSYGVLLILFGVSLCGSLLCLHRAADIFLWLYFRSAPSQVRVIGAMFLECAIIVLPPAVLSGLHFPLSGEICRRLGVFPGRATGLAYLFNSAGTLAGSLGTGFVLLPRLGAGRTLMFLAVAAVAAGHVVWLTQDPGALRRLRSLALAAVAAATAVAAVRSGEPQRLRDMQGLFRALNLDMARAPSWEDFRQAVASRAPPMRTLFVKEGQLSTVSVVQQSGNLSMSVGGKVDASLNDMPTQVLLGQLPMLLHDSPERVLVVGYGAGVTARNALDHGPRQLDIVEIEPAVLQAAAWFGYLTGDLSRRPETRISIEDGRTYLTYHSGQTYDVIVSEPSNPWVSGVNNLFTVEFYELVRRRLRPGGVFCQWFPMYELTDGTFATMLRSLHSVFPNLLLAEEGSDLICVAGRDGLPRLTPRSRQRLLIDDVRRHLADVGIASLADLLARFIGDGSTLSQAGPLNTDDNGYVEFHAPWELPAFQRRVLVVDRRRFTSSHPISLWRRIQGLAALGEAEVNDLLRAALFRDNLPLAEAVRTEWGNRLDTALETELSRQHQNAQRLKEAASLHAKGLALAHAGRADEALPVLRQALALRSTDVEVEDALVRLLMEAHDKAGSHTLLLDMEARGQWWLRYEMFCNLGFLDMVDGDTSSALRRFDQALATDPYRPDAYSRKARVLFLLGKPQEAREVLLAGLKNAPWSKVLAGDLAQLDAAPRTAEP